MPSQDHDDYVEPPKKGKTIKSASDSESFDQDITIHVPGLVGSATISPSGRDVALASPEGLAIIDLDSAWNPPRRLRSHGQPWLVVDVQWSPFAMRDYWVASAANHRCLVWNLNMSEESEQGAVEHSLEGHSRAITDINFSAHHPDMLATCGVDGYVNCWDLRRPRHPALSFCDWFSGATQVKYNRQDPHIIASSHDSWLHVWDERKTIEPLRSINAHTSKIYGIDWNRTRASGIVTCSVDKSIKFWDYNNEVDDPERVIYTDFPVWRARHAPFGWGLLAMPQEEPGSLYLYERRLLEDTPVEGYVEPVKVFTGHREHKVKEFLWRSRGGVSEDGLDNRDFQLVSWGEDNLLRLQRLDADVLSRVGYVKGQPVRRNLNFTRRGAAYKTFRTIEESEVRNRKAATMSDVRPGSQGNQGRRDPFHKSSFKGRPMKAKVTSRKDVNKARAQIGWMSGITMTRRKPSLELIKRTDSKESSLFGPGFPDDDWGNEPESIHDEFLRIDKTLPNVKWDHIDLDKLVFNASLKGPWGVGGQTIFIRVKVDVPNGYPLSRQAPKLVLEKTNLMPDETYAKIRRELGQMASQFVGRRQNCVGVALTYLLGEVDLETSTSWLKTVRDLEDDDDDDEGGGAGRAMMLVDESSSDDDDDGMRPGDSAMMSQELGMASDFDFRRRPKMTPRVSGARFSNDGRLVCFFGHEQPVDAEDAGEDAGDGDKGASKFAGFGRLPRERPLIRRRRQRDEDGSGGSDDNADDDDGGGSGGSESDIELSSSDSDADADGPRMAMVWYQPMVLRRIKKTWSEDHSQRSSGGGTGAETAILAGGAGAGAGASNGTATAGGVAATTPAPKPPPKARSSLAIHDLGDMLPSKKELAEEYAIFGDGPDVCEHNADVCRRHGYSELAHVWTYCGLLLKRGIPLELLEHDQRKNSILVIARDAAGVGLSSNQDKDTTSLLGRVKWGQHPLATPVIRDLMEYYEQVADVQMLAMLSCIFSEITAADDGGGLAYYAAESHLSQPETPLPMKTPSFSLDYFPSEASLWHPHHRSQGSSSGFNTPRTAATTTTSYATQRQQQPDGPGSAGSDVVVAWSGEPTSNNSYSAGDTPPTRAAPAKQSAMAQAKKSQSLSSSPNNRLLQRANSILGVNLPFVGGANATASTATNTAASSSSPVDGARKKLTPPDVPSGVVAPGAGMSTAVTWGASTIMGSASTGSAQRTGTSTTTPLLDEEARLDDMYGAAVAISVFMADQTEFDDDGWMTTPLLNPTRKRDYARYRHMYALMLQHWDQPLAALEILKFNVLKQAGDEAAGGGVDDEAADRAAGTGNASRASSDGRRTPLSAASGKEKKQQQHDANGATGPDADATSPNGTSEAAAAFRKDTGKRARRHLARLAASGRGLDISGICPLHDRTLYPTQYRPRDAGDDDAEESTGRRNPGGGVGTCDRCAAEGRGRAGALAADAVADADAHNHNNNSLAPPPPRRPGVGGGKQYLRQRSQQRHHQLQQQQQQLQQQESLPPPPPPPPRRDGALWTQLRCIYCLEPVDALFPCCLNCGCASHDWCLAEWHAAGEAVCAAGDECECVREASDGHVEGAAARAALLMQAHKADAVRHHHSLDQADHNRHHHHHRRLQHHATQDAAARAANVARQVARDDAAGAKAAAAAQQPPQRGAFLNRIFGALTSLGGGGGASSTAAAPGTGGGSGTTGAAPSTLVPPKGRTTRHHSVPAALDHQDLFLPAPRRLPRSRTEDFDSPLPAEPRRAAVALLLPPADHNPSSDSDHYPDSDDADDADDGDAGDGPAAGDDIPAATASSSGGSSATTAAAVAGTSVPAGSSSAAAASLARAASQRSTRSSSSRGRHHQHHRRANNPAVAPAPAPSAPAPAAATPLPVDEGGAAQAAAAAAAAASALAQDAPPRVAQHGGGNRSQVVDRPAAQPGRRKSAGLNAWRR